ncbi:hypothetical protein [Larkinella rosea]|uniref:Uncharacterized protein n=1 Tax=Larkinella rosea TaxID=2025312 RepID=A0A3P1BP23_9BACT|nr:hypothetical protein [Larkinella rosea]RRB02785.1 hypothetical protein EHT25_20290 [Larkinella rosea]
MNLDELKSTWKAYDEKMNAGQKLSEQLIFLMIKDRSEGTLAKMERKLLRASILMTAVIAFFSAAIIGNAFDYTHWYFYIPAGMYILLAVVALTVAVKNYRQLNRVNLSRRNLHDSLKTVLNWHEKAEATLSRIWLLCMLSGFLFAVSMVARKWESYSITKISLFLGFQALLILLLYAVARWIFTVFEDKIGKELREHMQELEQLETAV